MRILGGVTGVSWGGLGVLWGTGVIWGCSEVFWGVGACDFERVQGYLWAGGGYGFLEGFRGFGVCLGFLERQPLRLLGNLVGFLRAFGLFGGVWGLFRFFRGYSSFWGCLLVLGGGCSGFLGVTEIILGVVQVLGGLVIFRVCCGVFAGGVTWSRMKLRLVRGATCTSLLRHWAACCSSCSRAGASSSPTPGPCGCRETAAG